MKLITLLGLLAILLSGCFITNTPGFYSGYKKLTSEEKKLVVFTAPNDEICNLKNDQRIYAVTANQLLKCMKAQDTSVVYFWAPNCHSDVCVTMSAAQYYCDKKHYKLFVVAEYYDIPKMNQQHVNPGILYSVNHPFYKTDYCQKYCNRFGKALAGNHSLEKEDYYHRFYFFKQDKLVFTKNRLTEKAIGTEMVNPKS